MLAHAPEADGKGNGEDSSTEKKDEDTHRDGHVAWQRYAEDGN